MGSESLRPGLCGQQEEDDEDEIDPRIKVELESLNQAASDVNFLEKEINEARAKYQTTFSESSLELETLKSKFGSRIKRARPYYEMKEMAKEAQSEALRSARKFQSANSVYMAAKETISLAELRLMDDKAANLSAAWQEMLNHAVIRVMEAEKEKSKNEKDHLEKAATYAGLEKKMHDMERKFKKSIEKAKSYFEAKNELELKLQQIKQTIEDLQQAMRNTKDSYANSLKRLETISDGIHEIRRKKLMLMYPREPGVGAEESCNDNSDGQYQELPTLQSSEFDDSEVSSLSSFKHQRENETEEESIAEETQDEEDCIEDDNMYENQFRQKVLTCPLDKEESVFSKPRMANHKKLVKSMSLPSHLGEEQICEDVSSVFYCTKDIDNEDREDKNSTVQFQTHSQGQVEGNCDENLSVLSKHDNLVCSQNNFDDSQLKQGSEEPRGNDNLSSPRKVHENQIHENISNPRKEQY